MSARYNSIHKVVKQYVGKSVSRSVQQGTTIKIPKPVEILGVGVQIGLKIDTLWLEFQNCFRRMMLRLENKDLVWSQKRVDLNVINEWLPIRRTNLALKNEPFFNLHVSTPTIFLPFNLGPALIDVNSPYDQKGWMRMWNTEKSSFVVTMVLTLAGYYVNVCGPHWFNLRDPTFSNVYPLSYMRPEICLCKPPEIWHDWAWIKRG